jgi:predicted lipoprotein with Yx(FWY)xxD motif
MMALMKMRGRWVAVGAIGLLVGLFTGLAFATSHTTTLKTAHNKTIGKTIVVDVKGRTVYELRGETRHHLLCTSKLCLQNWPPVTVRSAKTKLSKAAGIKGKLRILHRDHFFQVTLGGLPLYRFKFDTAKGQANGQGIVAFGGTWHVVTASSHNRSSGSTTTGSTTTSPGYY